MRVILPLVAMYEGKTIWGYLRVVQEGDPPQTSHIELCSGPTPAGKHWKPFCTLTVLNGKIAFAFTGKQGYDVKMAGMLEEKESKHGAD